ncbi:transmembrane protein, putative [Bodo saltans]|uniref:Transmembrane protein, putative n=1 Tax=Bodo saltans TaxID=75058 RepID=A0A0S4JVZ7_BODSA|nr:transmembrane protein, putative [Bodo saltans]|eukprot:CUG93627.1 transmembrane protein, putative [Bodo saltans]
MQLIAGSATLTGSINGVGLNAIFVSPRGILVAINTSNLSTETLVVADRNDNCIRSKPLAALITSRPLLGVVAPLGNVTDGAAVPAARFNGSFGVTWYCNGSASTTTTNTIGETLPVCCGVLVADFDSNAIRFVSLYPSKLPQPATAVTITQTRSRQVVYYRSTTSVSVRTLTSDASSAVRLSSITLTHADRKEVKTPSATKSQSNEFQVSAFGVDPGASVYIMSVFFDQGPVSMVIGNIGLCVFVFLCQFVIVTAVARYQQQTSSRPAVEGKLRFPAMAIRIIDFLMPGTMFSAFLCFWSQSMGGAARCPRRQ